MARMMLVQPQDWLGWSILGSTALALAFLAGSVPFGFLMAKSKGLDLRQHGSGNIGATNVWRVMGRKWGTAAFVLDFIKGAGPLLLVNLVMNDWTAKECDWIRVLTGIGAILGHNYTPWLGFKGGKGIATSAGVLLCLVPITFGLSVVTWGLLFFSTRYVSVASIGAALSLPVVTLIFYPGQTPLLGFCLLASVLAVLRHKGNLQRLRAGTEPRFVKKKPEVA